MFPGHKKVPPHLRRYIVQQDYAQYNEMDQAVWRFVLLQLYARLKQTAHKAYCDGLRKTGISVERIPHVGEMNECLAPFGWGAVCVDGFIPPRAFQEFQAAGLLPIAAGMRTRDHLVYTPAPDIIHEAAGHAPILTDPVYSEYIQQSGMIGGKAFTTADDARVYQAIYELSEIKEDPSSTPEQVQKAERMLAQVSSSVSRVSEATRMSRLYWWTAEYGLVSSLEGNRIYGAGLLSSLWESHTCLGDSVRKIPLSVACMDVAYEITQPQPQLFVARDFEHLLAVLAEASLSLAYRKGGRVALEEAIAAAEVATVELSSGVQLMGVLAGISAGASAQWLRWRGPVGLALGGKVLPGGLTAQQRQDYILPLGALVGGMRLEDQAPAVLSHWEGSNSALCFRFESGCVVSGRFKHAHCDSAGKLRVVSLVQVRIEVPGEPPLDCAEYDLAVGISAVTAYAGAADPSYYPDSEFSTVCVPKPRTLPVRERDLLQLYEQAVASFRAQVGGQVTAVFERIFADLRREHPDEWLLRWNLLESLLKLRIHSVTSEVLQRELELMEVRFMHREPIASGLRYLRDMVVS